LRRNSLISTSLLDSMPVILPIGRAGGEAGCQMLALVLEVYGAFSVLSLIAFLNLASVAKLRSDLDQEAVDVGALEKVTKLASSEQFGNALPVEHPIIEHASRSAPRRPVKQSKRLIQRRPHRIYARKPRRPDQAA
jgi:hypothetical protein